ncbi:MAG: AraC family transcriptional regulator [Steroidobacteraceae bacterium]
MRAWIKTAAVPVIMLLAMATARAEEPVPAPAADRSTLDAEVQELRREVVDLNRDLFMLEEDLLFPASTQIAVFISMDVGTFFDLDSVQVRVDGKEVSNYLYTAREREALLRGGVQRIWVGNMKAGEHELVAFFTGKGTHQRDYKRGATLTVDKGVGAKYVELRISDRVRKLQPEFVIRVWE